MRTKHESRMPGHEFKRWRKNVLRLTAEQTAAIVGVTLRAVQAWEQGHNPVPAYAVNCLTMHGNASNEQGVASCKA